LRRGYVNSCGCERNRKSGERLLENKYGRRYKIDEHYFDKIDTAEKAYWLGFIYADGYNYVKKYTIAVNLAVKDKHLLIRLRAAIGYTGKIFHRKSGKCGGVVLRFASKHMSTHLRNIGMVQAKSLILKFPSTDVLPRGVESHFIRGYFDGDGTVNKNGSLMSILGTKIFLVKLRKILMENCKLNSTKLHRFGKIYSLGYGGNTQMARIFNYLYKDAPFYLERKRTRFLKNVRIFI